MKTSNSRQLLYMILKSHEKVANNLNTVSTIYNRELTMRLWSVHPKYLDTKGLTACWREGLLARKVLLGQTKGYRNHPQLTRFRQTQNPVTAVDAFLSYVLAEAQSRGYNFDATKINISTRSEEIRVTRGQLEYEFEHLKKRLAIRDKAAFERITSVTDIAAHPLFAIVDGGIEDWEIRR